MFQVGVKGQYFLQIYIEGVIQNEKGAGKLQTFVMEEKIGGDLPAFNMSFTSSNKGIVKHFKQGAKVFVTFGKDWEGIGQKRFAKFTLQKFGSSQDDSDFITITLSGIVDRGAEYLQEVAQKSWKEEYSDVVIRETVENTYGKDGKKYFNWDTGIPNGVSGIMSTINNPGSLALTPPLTNDAMNWLRANSTPSQFVQQVWKRSYISDDDSPIFAIRLPPKLDSNDGIVLDKMNDIFGMDLGLANFTWTSLRTITSRITGTPWVLKQMPADAPQVPRVASYYPDVSINSDYGLMSYLATNERVTPLHNIDTKQQGHVKTPNPPTKGPQRVENVKSITERNVHENFHRATLVTLPALSMSTSVALDVTIENIWYDYQIFDMIYFHPWRPQSVSNYMEEIETIGGWYTITRIARYYQNNRAVTKLTISRDGMKGWDMGSWIAGAVGSLIKGVIDAII